MQAAEQAIEEANEALEEASEAVAEASEEQEQRESSESEAADEASGSQSQASAGESSSSGSINAAGDSDDTGGKAGEESVASSETASSSEQGDQDASSVDQETVAEQGGAAELQAAGEATEEARQALQELVDLIAALQVAAAADNDPIDDSSDGPPEEIGSPEFQEAFKKAVGEALIEAAQQIQQASIALAEAARQAEGEDSADAAPRSAAAGSDQTRQGAEPREAGEGVSDEELEDRLTDIVALAAIMNAINNGMQAADQDGLSSASQQTYTGLILEGDATIVPGSILLPGGIIVPLGLPGGPGQQKGDGSPGGVLVAGGMPRGSDDGQGSAGSGSGTVVIIPGARSSGDRVAILDTALSRTLAIFDGVILASQGSKLGTSPGIGGGFGDEGPDAGFGGVNGQTDTDGDGPKIAGAGQIAGETAEGQQKPGATSGSSTPVVGKQSGTQSLNRPPADIPDGSDDDVVAKQIREAAENERDPELRDKLWDEYRAYKKGTGQ